MSFCVCDSVCPQSHLCDIPWSLFATSLSSCFPCLFACCSKFHQLSRMFAILLSSFFSPSLILCLLFSLPPSPTCYIILWLHTLYTTILFSAFSPHLLCICYYSIFQLSHLYYSPPSIPQPHLLSSLPPLFCVYDSICHPPPPVWLPSLYNSALSLLLSSSPILCLLLLWLMFLCGSCSQRQSEFYYCWPPTL